MSSSQAPLGSLVVSELLTRFEHRTRRVWYGCQPLKDVELLEGLKVKHIYHEQAPNGGNVVVTFHHSSSSACLFGYRWRDVDGSAREIRDGEGCEEHAVAGRMADMIMIDLEEEVEAGDRGLPSPCETDGVNWL